MPTHEDTVWQGSLCLESEYCSDARMLFGYRALRSAAHDDHSDDDGPEVQSKPHDANPARLSPPSVWSVLCQPTRRIVQPKDLPRPASATQCRSATPYVVPEVPLEWENEE